MVREIIWTKRANQKFNKIIQYLQNEWGDNVTESFVKKSYIVIELLAQQPHLGMLENIGKEIYGFPVTKHNRLFYRITDEEFIILNFFDTRSSSRVKNIKASSLTNSPDESEFFGYH